MAKNTLQTIIGAFELNGTKTFAVDHVQNYPITLQDYNNITTVKIPISEARYAHIKDEISDELKQVGIKRSNYHKEVFSVTLNKPKKAIDQYTEIRSIVASKLSAYTHEFICPYCHQYHTDTLAVYDNLFQPVHAACYQGHMNQIESEITRSDHRISEYLLGAIGAVVGGILPMLLAAVLIFVTDTSFGWLYFLCATIASVGYQKMKGPIGKWALLIVMLSSILSFVLFLYGSNLFALWQAGYRHIGVFAKIRIITSFIFSSDFITTYWFEALFFVIGLVVNVISGPFSKKKSMEEHQQMTSLSIPMNMTSTQ